MDTKLSNNFTAARRAAWQAGVWEQGHGFVAWSAHRTEAAARRAAVKYAKQATNQGAGGALSWAGGVTDPGGSVVWFDRDGEVVAA